MAAKPKKIVLSSETGRTVSKEFAKANPKSTVAVSIDLDKPFDLKKFKVPKTLAQCADLAYELRERRLAVSKQADNIEVAEKLLKEHLIQNLPKSEASGVAGKTARAKIEKKDVPRVADKKKLLAHIKKTGDFDLLQAAINTAAVQERWDAKKKVPGVESFTVVKVSLTKV